MTCRESHAIPGQRWQESDQEATPLQARIDKTSCLVAYVLLVDTMHALHSGRTLNLSVGELFIKMPTSDHQIRHIYQYLIGGCTLPSDI